jgi:hypothetical protein
VKQFTFQKRKLVVLHCLRSKNAKKRQKNGVALNVVLPRRGAVEVIYMWKSRKTGQVSKKPKK